MHKAIPLNSRATSLNRTDNWAPGVCYREVQPCSTSIQGKTRTHQSSHRILTGRVTSRECCLLCNTSRREQGATHICVAPQEGRAHLSKGNEEHLIVCVLPSYRGEVWVGSTSHRLIGLSVRVCGWAGGGGNRGTAAAQSNGNWCPCMYAPEN